MAHGITEYDSIVSTSASWHGLDVIVPAIDSLETSKLNWIVRKESLVTATGAPIEGFDAIMSKHTEKDLILSVRTNGYEIIQNSAVWEAMESGLAGIPHSIVNAGSLHGRKTVFFTVELTGENKKILSNGDEFRTYAIFMTSHDGSKNFHMFDSSTRVVCQNTLSAAYADRRQQVAFNVAHTKNCAFRIVNMAESLNRLFDLRKEFYNSMEYLASRPMLGMTIENRLHNARAFYAGLMADKALSTRTGNVIVAITNKLLVGSGLEGKGITPDCTLADVLNVGTEYHTHENDSANADKVKAELLLALCNPDAVTECIARGEKILKLATDKGNTNANCRELALQLIA